MAPTPRKVYPPQLVKADEKEVDVALYTPNYYFVMSRSDAMGYSSFLKNALELPCTKVTLNVKGVDKEFDKVDVKELVTMSELETGLDVLYYKSIEVIADLDTCSRAAKVGDALNVPTLVLVCRKYLEKVLREYKAASMANRKTTIWDNVIETLRDGVRAVEISCRFGYTDLISAVFAP